MEANSEKPKQVKKTRRVFRGETLRLTVNLVLAIVIFFALRRAFPVEKIKARMGKHYSLAHREKKIRGSHGGALVYSGLKLLKKGKLDKAVINFTELIRVVPRFAPGYYRLGQSLAALDRHEESITHLKAAVKLQPNFAEAYFLLGKNLLILNKSPEASLCLKKAILLKPDLDGAHTVLGTCLFDQGKFDQALEILRKGIKHHPDDPIIYLKLAKTLEALQKGDIIEPDSENSSSGR